MANEFKNFLDDLWKQIRNSLLEAPEVARNVAELYWDYLKQVIKGLFKRKDVFNKHLLPLDWYEGFKAFMEKLHEDVDVASIDQNVWGCVRVRIRSLVHEYYVIERKKRKNPPPPSKDDFFDFFSDALMWCTFNCDVYGK